MIKDSKCNFTTLDTAGTAQLHNTMNAAVFHLKRTKRMAFTVVDLSCISSQQVCINRFKWL